MRYWVTMMVLLAAAGTGPAFAPDPAPEPQQRVLAQFSVGTGTTLVGFRVARRAGTADDEPAAPNRFCLRLPFGCALVMESMAANGAGVVVRPQFGPIAFEVAVSRVQPSGS